MVHTIMRTIAGFSFARFALGLTESAVFPAIVKIVAEWFPRKERALVMGILNSGSNIAAIIAPIVVPWLFVSFGWRWAFWGTGAIGFLWLLCWLWFYRTPDKHPRLSAGERAYIQSDPPEAVQTPISWKSLLTLRQTWAFIAAKFFTDAVWRWNLYLLPLFFHQVFKLDIRNFGLPFVTIYAMADVGSICGGWFSSSLLKRGYSINAARKTAMLVCALCVVPVVCAPLVPQMYVAVFVVGLASAAHQGFSTNIFTTVSDMFPKQAVASVTGIGGTAGALGAMLLLGLTSRLFEGAPADPTRVYCTLFAIASVAYLLGLGIMHVLAPKMRPVAPSDLESPQVDTP